ncbi:Transmembrane protein 39A [Homalodisca vitripennis]|nr:Transmembrane protein 39A [Homalodisca vitripennis]
MFYSHYLVHCILCNIMKCCLMRELLLQNFYLIDPYLVGFIGTILGRRLLYSLVSEAVMVWTPPSIWAVLQQLVRLLLLSIVLASLIWCTYNIMQNHPIVNIFYLCYP